MAKILVVEDDWSLADMTARGLRESGNEVTVAGTLDDGLRQIGESVPDLVITDLMLDDKSGLDMLRQARDLPQPPEVILITAHPTALTAAQAMTAALLARERTGKGQHVRLAMLDAVIHFLWPEGMARHTYLGRDVGVSRPTEVRDLVFETKDGFITAGAVADVEWHGLARALGHPEWLEDERFKTPAGRVKHADKRLEMTAEVLATGTSEEWLKILDEHQVPCAPVMRREDLVAPVFVHEGAGEPEPVGSMVGARLERGMSIEDGAE